MKKLPGIFWTVTLTSGLLIMAFSVQAAPWSIQYPGLTVGLHAPVIFNFTNEDLASIRFHSISYATPTPVNFPDANLEAAIRGAIGKPSGDIYTSDLESLTSFDAHGKNIANLSGLEYCVNLTGLILYNNRISDVSPLSNLSKLENLDLTRNRINTFSALSNLPNLKELYLSYNQIQSLTTLSNVTNLIKLGLANNQISDISALSTLTQAEYLNLANNQIINLSPLVSNTGIGSGDEVHLKGNPLSDESIDSYIPQLIARGATIDYDPPVTYTLTVNASPANGGTFSLSKDGPYRSGVQVTLTAIPAIGYTFDHWSGAASGTTNPVTITMNSNEVLWGYFTQIPYILTLNASPANSGTFMLSNNGPYHYGDQVTITPNPAGGYSFSGWSGDATGNMVPLTVTMDVDKTLTGNFIPSEYSLTVNVIPAGKGFISLSKYGSYHNGDQVIITAIPATGYRFSEWSGDASGSANPVTVTIDGIKNVTATFARKSSGGGGGGGGTSLNNVTLSGLSSPGPIFVNSSGTVSANSQVTSLDGALTLDISAGTKMLNKENKALTNLSAVILRPLPAAPEGTVLVKAYDLGPEGAAFEPSLKMIYHFTDTDIPAECVKEDLYLAYYEVQTKKWIPITGLIDTVKNTLTVEISHFSTFAIFTPTAANFDLSDLEITPTTVDPGAKVTIITTVRNRGGKAGSYPVTLTINDGAGQSVDAYVNANGSQKVTFEVIKQEPGDYRVNVGKLYSAFKVSPATYIPPAVTTTPQTTALSPAITSALTPPVTILASAPFSESPPAETPGPEAGENHKGLPLPYLIGAILTAILVLGFVIWYFLRIKRQKKPKTPLGQTIDFSEYDRGYLFPIELEKLYGDATFIGDGGFARVFKVRRRNDGLEVAVKVPVNLDVATGKSFLKEISSWQLLDHDNIVKLLDFNILPIPYLEMELCERSLNDLIKPLDIYRASNLIFDIADGLKYAHSRNVIHRDLKPQNILLNGDTAKISDWGMSKIVTSNRDPLAQSLTPLYAAPEQLAHNKFGQPDQRTDIYQLGVVFYELVTGRLPFRSDNMVELIEKIINHEPEKTSSINPCTRRIEPIIMKCCKKQMHERYQVISELQRDLVRSEMVNSKSC